MKNRIWELDALRGLCLVLVVAFHLWYDLVYLFGLIPLRAAGLFRLMNDWGGVAFLVISGVCVTLGKHPVRRGLAVFGCGMVISLVTVGMYLLNFTGKGIIIYFGVLHCLGVCMLLWPLLKTLPVWALASMGVILAAVGIYLKFSGVAVSFPWLMPLGIPYWGFTSSDYFPLMPNLGYFLIGAFLGRTLYRSRQSLLPQLPGMGVFSWIGRHSLLIYLLHQPVLAGAVLLFTEVIL